MSLSRRIVIALFFALNFSVLHLEEIKANPIVLAAPPLAIGSLEVMAAAAGAAASLGVISASQNQNFQQQVAEDIEKIKIATSEGIDETVNNAVLFYGKVLEKMQNKQCIEKTEASKEEPCTASIEVCCGNFLSKFANQVNKSRGGLLFRIGKQKMNCCMEWDHLHGGLEIFDKRGRHMGERGCDDLTDDPCEWTRSRGKHAQPSSMNHKPRSAACQP